MQRSVFGRDVAFFFRSIYLIALVLSVSCLIADDTPPDSTRGLAMYPLGLYSSEMGLGAGGVVMYIYHPKEIPAELPPNSLLAQALYTTKGQFRGTVKPELQILRGLMCLKADLDYKYWPDSFYGLGNHTKTSDKESYTSEGGEVEITALRRMPKGWGVELSGHLRRWSLSDKEEGGILQTVDIPGGSGGSVVGFGCAVEYDTRDNTFSTNKGDYAQFRVRVYDDALGSDFNYTKYKLDVRRFYLLFPRMVLGVQGIGEYIDGNPPFMEMARTGGEIRGIASLRYLGKSMITARSEMRFYPFSGRLSSRLGFAVFAAASQVAMDASDLRFNEFTFTGGVGLRLLLLPKDNMTLRLDFGFSSDDREMEATATEAF